MTVLIRRGMTLPPVREKELLRYAGGGDDRSALALIDGINKNPASMVCYALLDAEIDGEVCKIGGLELRSAKLAKCLFGCRKAVIFCATVGFEYDRLIAASTRLSPAKALMISALGSERAEAVCDAFCDSIEKELSVKLTPRFSPGYGDLSLEVQKDIFALLEPTKRIGVSLSDQMIMTPTKSVTAIAGICEKKK